ncbi:hypothetical protein FF1_011549 [Malus domestica]
MEIKVLVRLRIYTLIMLCTYLDLRLLCVVYQGFELPDNAKPGLQSISYAESLKDLCSCPLFCAWDMLESVKKLCSSC